MLHSNAAYQWWLSTHTGFQTKIMWPGHQFRGFTSAVWPELCESCFLHWQDLGYLFICLYFIKHPPHTFLPANDSCACQGGRQCEEALSSAVSPVTTGIWQTAAVCLSSPHSIPTQGYSLRRAVGNNSERFPPSLLVVSDKWQEIEKKECFQQIKHFDPPQQFLNPFVPFTYFIHAFKMLRTSDSLSPLQTDMSGIGNRFL